MKSYDVCAIGNAMVDYEIKVEDSFFEANEVEKGLMTLVDEDRQQVLLEVVGEKITKKEGGGSAANTMVAFSQLGGRGYYSCKVANDDDGRFYLQDLHDNGLDTNLSIENLESGTTGKCLVMISPDAERTMNTFLGITTDFSTREVSEEAIKRSKYIYLEGALISSPTGRIAMKKARQIAIENGVKVSLTFWDPSMVKYFRNEMIELVGDGLDLIFCNEEEARLFTGKEDLEEAKTELVKKADKIVMTLGKDGAVIWDGEKWVSIDPVAVKAVDTTGAGDMYAGAFLYGLTQGHPTKECGNLASLASSMVVSKYGPRLEKKQMQEIKNEVLA